MTKQTMRKQFIRLLNIHGISSDEGKVREYLYSCLQNTMSKVEVDSYGNLLAEKKFGTGKGAVVMLSAHMDTVSSVYADRKVIERDGFFMSDYGTLGADDRAGIAIILEVLRNLNNLSSFNGILKIAFSREEEIGCIGASRISHKWYSDVDLAIIVDRRGTRDIVTGCSSAFCSDAVGVFMENVAGLIDQKDWECVEGGISDAMVFSSNGINSINLSAGYDNEHTSNEYASLEAMKDTAKLILQAFAVIDDFAGTFGEVPKHNKWVQPYVTNYKQTHYKGTDGSWYEEDYYSEKAYSISDYMKPDYTTPDGDIEVYVISADECMLKQDDQEMYVSGENFDYIMTYLKNQLKGAEIQ